MTTPQAVPSWGEILATRPEMRPISVQCGLDVVLRRGKVQWWWEARGGKGLDAVVSRLDQDDVGNALCLAHAIEWLGKKGIVAMFNDDWHIYDMSDLSNPLAAGGPFPDLDTAVRAAVVGVEPAPR